MSYIPDLPPWLDASAVLAAVLGAIAGGGASYWGTRALDESKQNKTTLRLYSLLLLELLEHHTDLFLEIDAFLPSWLRRGESFLSATSAVADLHFRWLHLRLWKLTDEYYSRFLPDLIHADLIVELASYYRDIRNHNRKITDWNPEHAIDDVPPYVRNVLFLFRSGKMLIQKIRDIADIKNYFVIAHGSALENFDAIEAKGSYLLALADLRMPQLLDLQTAKMYENASDEERADWKWVGAEPPSTEGVPELIRNDPTRLWESYLAEALKIAKRSQSH